MTSEHIIQDLERYRNELVKIMDRFTRSSGGYHIHQEDDPRFRTIVIELIDFLNDSIGTNKYSPLVNQIFNEGISNFTHSPSYKSVENIVSLVLNPVLTRLKRNPEFFNQKEIAIDQEKSTIEYPNKITLKWLWSHVPYRFWAFLFGLLITAFSLGITFANTKLYNSLTDLLTVKTNINKKTEAKQK